MNDNQSDMVNIALRILSMPDFSYTARSENGNENQRQMVEKLFEAVYDKPLDRTTMGVHWLARTAIHQAICRRGYFRRKWGFWEFLFYVYSVGSGVLGFAIWWRVVHGG